MIVAAAVEVTEDVTTTADTEVDAVMTETVAMAETVMTTALVEVSTATLAMTATAAVGMIVAEVDTGVDVITTEAEIVALPVKHLLQLLPMVIQHLVERLGNHTEVEATMKRDSPVANIDC